MVYSGLYPIDGDDYPTLRDALERLQLNDAALTFEPETSGALGFGFRIGFLGLLHMEITRDRLEREFDLDLISTAPNVVYEVLMEDGTKMVVTNPSEYPEGKIAEVHEPVVKATILSPSDYIGTIMELCQTKRGNLQGMDYLSEDRVEMRYTLPMGEIVFDFFDQLKSRTKGYASLDYERSGEQAADLVKVDILLQGEPVDAFSAIVHREAAYGYGVMMAGKLKDLIPRQQFEVPIQAAIGARVIARENIRAIRKDVLAKCYGGDITRKRKLLEKQKEGKKRMKMVGRVEVPAGGLHRRAVHHAADRECRRSSRMTAVVRSQRDVAPQPWANGGGTTRELLVAEDGAWRVSLAEIEQDGPFSSFPGRAPPADRRRRRGARARRRRRRAGGRAAPARSPSTATPWSSASIPEGPVRALNVIVDPAAVSPHVTVLELGRGSTLPIADRPGRAGAPGTGTGRQASRRRRTTWSWGLRRCPVAARSRSSPWSRDSCRARQPAHRSTGSAVGLGNDLGDHGQRDLAGSLPPRSWPGRDVQPGDVHALADAAPRPGPPPGVGWPSSRRRTHPRRGRLAARAGAPVRRGRTARPRRRVGVEAGAAVVGSLHDHLATGSRTDGHDGSGDRVVAQHQDPAGIAGCVRPRLLALAHGPSLASALAVVTSLAVTPPRA